MEKQKTPEFLLNRTFQGFLLVDPLGLEPRLFWTKTRRVASYTMGHYYGLVLPTCPPKRSGGGLHHGALTGANL
jgi:hypothetical protein